MSDETAKDDLFRNMPRRIHVGAYTFRILIVESAHAKLDGNAAVTMFEEFRIYVDDALPFQRAAEVMQHEVSHCINWVYGVNDDSDEETFVTQHSKGLTDFRLKNPRMDTWLNSLIKRMRKEAKSD